MSGVLNAFVVLVATDLALGHLNHPLPRRIDFKLLALPTPTAVGTNAGFAPLTQEPPAGGDPTSARGPCTLSPGAPAFKVGVFPGIPLTILPRGIRVLPAVAGA